MKKTIAIDLDGVLDNYTKYTDDIPPIKEGAEEFIIKLSKDYDLILFTTRSEFWLGWWGISLKPVCLRNFMKWKFCDSKIET